MEKLCCIVNQTSQWNYLSQLLSAVFVHYVRDGINIIKQLVRIIDCGIQKGSLDNKDQNY